MLVALDILGGHEGYEAKRNDGYHVDYEGEMPVDGGYPAYEKGGEDDGEITE